MKNLLQPLKQLTGQLMKGVFSGKKSFKTMRVHFKNSKKHVEFIPKTLGAFRVKKNLK